MSEEKVSKLVTEKEAGARLDAFLSDSFPTLSRRSARVLCREGSVAVNGRAARPGLHLRTGDEISVTAALVEVRADPRLIEAEPQRAAAVKVLFEDEDLVVVYKPPNMASVRLRGDDPLTLADCLSAHCPLCIEASSDLREAGLVQRLDYSTSGLLLAAKSREMWQRLHSMLLSGGVEKRYFALVEGRIPEPEMEIVLPLRPIEGGRKMEAVHAGPSTESVLLARSMLREHAALETNEKRFSIVEVQGEAMRRHQVRVHLAAVGAPLVGDLLYGASSGLGDLGLNREGFLLHAQHLSLRHPRSGALLEFDEESPEFAAITTVS